MKIDFLIKSLECEGGGAERVLATVASELALRGHVVTVFTSDPADFKPYYIIDPSVNLQGLNFGNAVSRTKIHGFLAMIRKLRRLFVSRQPDLVIGFMHSMYVPLSVALLGTNVPFVASEHIASTHYKARRLEGALATWAQKRATLVTVPAASISKGRSAAIADKIIILPNPVDLSAYAGSADKPSFNARPVILNAGRFVEQKNQLELIRAFSRIVSQFPDWKLRIVGDGELRQPMERLILELGMSEFIELPGIVRDMAREYSAASFLVLPSHYEAMPLVVMEALASGRPVLGFSHCEGLSELIESGRNGVLLPATSDRVAALAGGMAELMANPDHCCALGSTAAASISHFGTERIVENWQALLAQASSCSSAVHER